MALPESTETSRTVALRQIVEAAGPEEILAWPKPTENDLALFGRIVHFFSAFDFVLRYLAETMDKQQMFKEPWAGKTQKLTMEQVSQAIQSSPIWVASNKFALERIDSHRRVRNLVAHFLIRRFPRDDAFIFMTKSALDYKRVYNVLPSDIDAMLYGVLDAAQLSAIVPELEGLLKWATQVLGDLSRPVEP